MDQVNPCLRRHPRLLWKGGGQEGAVVDKRAVVDEGLEVDLVYYDKGVPEQRVP